MSVTTKWIKPWAVPAKDLTVRENGIYHAEAGGLYAYPKVTVDVATEKVIGKDPQTGEKVEISVNKDGGDDDSGGTTEEGDDGYGDGFDDGGSGYDTPKPLVEKVLPSGIVLEKPPDKTSYTDGEPIDYSGMIVRLVLASGETFTDERYPDGQIPLSELDLPVTTATIPPDAIVISRSTCTSLDLGTVGGPNGQFDFGTGAEYRAEAASSVRPRPYIEMTISGPNVCIFLKDYWNVYCVAASEDPDATQTVSTTISSGSSSSETDVLSSSFTHQGQTVYYTPFLWNYRYYGEVVSAAPLARAGFVSAELKNLAWAMVYGDVETGRDQTIPVNWTNPYDNSQASASFSVWVHSEGAA